MKDFLKRLLLDSASITPLMLIVFVCFTFATWPLFLGSTSVDRSPRAVTVMVENGGFGSGVLVSKLQPDGSYVSYVWTAYHVVTKSLSPQEKIIFLLASGHGAPQAIPVEENVHVRIGTNLYEASVVDYSDDVKGYDLALLRIWTPNISKASVQFATGKPAVGDRVINFSNFYGPAAPNSEAIGNVAYVGRDTGEAHLLDQIACPVYPGSSGGGVYNDAGQCIGLCHARIEECLGTIIPAQDIIRFARSRGLDFAL